MNEEANEPETIPRPPKGCLWAIGSAVILFVLWSLLFPEIAWTGAAWLTIDIRLADAATKQPIPNATVTLLPDPPAHIDERISSPTVLTAQTDSSGRAVLKHMFGAGGGSHSTTIVVRSSLVRCEAPGYALCGFSARRTPRACHGACARLRPGRFRASHAVCLRYSTLEPVICARKEETDNESVPTIERIRIELFAMRSVNPSFRADSLRSLSASSSDFSDSLPHPLQNEKTPNNGAAENRSGRLRSVTACASTSGASAYSGRFSCAPPLAQAAPARSRPPRSLSLCR